MASSTRSHILPTSLVVGGCFVQAALPHGVDAHGAVAHHAAHVDAFPHAVHGRQVFAVGLPVPRQAGVDGALRDVLHGLHHLRQIASVLRLAGRESDAAVAGDHGGDAVVAGGRSDGAPKRICASRWVWISTKPGVTVLPPASISRLPLPSTSPTAAMRFPETATSPRLPGAPVPSTRGAVANDEIVGHEDSSLCRLMRQVSSLRECAQGKVVSASSSSSHRETGNCADGRAAIRSSSE